MDSNKLVALPSARNTQEDLQDFVAFAGKDALVIVCTSAIHMPRAMEWFLRAEANPVAAPTDYIIKKQTPQSWWMIVPNFQVYKQWQNVLKEQIGIWYFNFLGDK